VAKFATGVIDTGGKFAAGVVDTGGKQHRRQTTLAANLQCMSNGQNLGSTPGQAEPLAQYFFKKSHCQSHFSLVRTIIHAEDELSQTNQWTRCVPSNKAKNYF
jgi:hypothetical protein